MPWQAHLLSGMYRFADRIFQKIAGFLRKSLGKDFWCLRLGTNTIVWFGNLSGFDTLWAGRRALFLPFSIMHGMGCLEDSTEVDPGFSKSANWYIS